MAFSIYNGENVVIKFPLFILVGGDIWQGLYDNTQTYNANDVVLGDDDIGYRCILTTTGNAPPNATYWVALDPVLRKDVGNFKIELIQPATTDNPEETTLLTWEYMGRIKQLSSGSLIVDQWYLIFDFEAGDDFTNVGGTNSTGAMFKATGTTPTTWSHSSKLYQVSFPPAMQLADGLFQLELLDSDTVPLQDYYNLKVSIKWDNTDFFVSGGQTDVLCLDQIIKVIPC